MEVKSQMFLMELGADGLLQIRSKKDSSSNINISGILVCTVTAQKKSMPWKKGDSTTTSTEKLVAHKQITSDGFILNYDKLGTCEPFFGISLFMEVVLQNNNAIVFNVQISNNNDEWIITEVLGPEISGISVSPDDNNRAIVWPNGLGQRYVNFEEFGKKVLSYPSGSASMPWFTITFNQEGIYFGSHDPIVSARDIILEYNNMDRTVCVGVKHFPFCKSGETWTSPPFIIKSYIGSWHEAAVYYRNWYDTVANIMTPPAWAKNSSGWLLAVLKQQNGEVMWDYRDGIDKLCDVAEERGLDTIGLFGWAHGGHDYLYPDYIPDILIGGKQAICEALQRARSRGIRTIIYANGVIMDTSTDFYRYQGNDAILYKENQEPSISSIRKFNSATPVTFAKGCPGSDSWRKQMFMLALQANELGADGILYDQIGVFSPECCHCKSHKHKSPSTAYAIERKSMITEIAKHMRTINPDFIVMTEGIHDTLLSGITYVHGWGCGFSPSRNKQDMLADNLMFLELFRYTFPELPMLQRHSVPMLSRFYANYACLYGLRYEIETRYQPDVNYLLNAKMPEINEYKDIAYYPPDVELMRNTKIEIATQYLKDIINFSNRFAHFLRHGVFIDTKSFTIYGGDVIAKAYKSGNDLAVCVWNDKPTPQQCEITVDGMKLKECMEPEISSVNAQTSIPPQSVRMYVFTKEG